MLRDIQSVFPQPNNATWVMSFFIDVYHLTSLTDVLGKIVLWFERSAIQWPSILPDVVFAMLVFVADVSAFFAILQYKLQICKNFITEVRIFYCEIYSAWCKKLLVDELLFSLCSVLVTVDPLLTLVLYAVFLTGVVLFICWSLSWAIHDLIGLLATANTFIWDTWSWL